MQDHVPPPIARGAFFAFALLGGYFLEIALRLDLSNIPIFIVTFAVGLSAVLLHGRAIYAFILPVSALGSLFQGVLIFDLVFPQLFILSLLQPLILVALIEFTRGLIAASEFYGLFDSRRPKAMGVFILIIMIASVVGALLRIVQHLIIPALELFTALSFTTALIGYFSALLFVVPFVYLSEFETRANWFQTKDRAFIYETIFLLTYTVFLLVLISGAFQFHFIRHLYVVIAFFILAAVVFTHRTLVIMIITLYVLYATLYFDPQWAFDAYVFEIGTFYVFMASMLVVILIFKRYMESHTLQLRHTEESTRQLDTTLEYIERFLSLSDYIFDSKMSPHFYAKETYDLVRLIFPQANHTFAYMEESGTLRPIVSSRYTDERFPLLHALHDATQIRQQNLIIHENLKDSFQFHYPDANFTKADTIARTKRIVLVFNIAYGQYLMVGLDFLHNKQHINIERKHEFTNLMNNLFTKHFVQTQNIILRDDIIRAFVRTLDLYDHYTKGHSEDVARLSQAIAKAMDKDDDFVQTIYWAGLLHDIGKLGVDAPILNKNGKLTDEEYSKIKDHVNYSVSILQKSDLLEDVAQMVKDHHERWDGKGYPSGIKETTISLGGQIIGVADAIATMATHRPYRRALSVEIITKELRANMGTQFSPRVIETVLPMLDKQLYTLIKA